MPKRTPRLPPDLDILAHLRTLSPAWRAKAVEMLGEYERESLDRDWPGWAHEGQHAPLACADGAPWATWVLMAGRGFGKTLAGAKWITGLIAEGEPLSIALVGATLEDARRVMIEGRSGLLEVAGAWVTEWHPSLRRLKFRTGAEATLFSGATPHLLRGPEHHYAWCDELAKWEKAQESWEMLQLGLRVGAQPRALITTTPGRGAILRAIMDEPDTVTTRGPTRRNPHIAPAFKRRVERLYAGTRLGRQELEGELLPDAAGALWTVEVIEKCRLLVPLPEREGLGVGCEPQASADARTELDDRGIEPRPPKPTPDPSLAGRGAFIRTVIAVDPPSGDGTCGIIACARDANDIAHILADHSVTGRSPDGWAGAVADAAAIHGRGGIPCQVIAETNQGGKMVAAVLHSANPALRVKMVTATQGKTVRAEPVSRLFEAGKVVLHGRFRELEAELLGMIAGGKYEGPGTSPDRADAMVWGVTELMPGRRAEARVRAL